MRQNGSAKRWTISVNPVRQDALGIPLNQIFMSSQIRKYLLLTLSHAEVADRVHYTPHFMLSKCRSLFNCESVVVEKKLHVNQGYHYHVGILNDTASCYTVSRILREFFLEFKGRQLKGYNVTFHKSWTTVRVYVFKQNKDALCWETTESLCVKLLHRREKGKRSAVVSLVCVNA